MERDFGRYQYTPELESLDPNLAEIADIYHQPKVWDRARFAFNDRQRGAIRQRDENKCQFPDDHACNGDDKLEVHHVIPQRYAKEIGIPDPDVPENALTICSQAHDLIHPDRVKARRTYHKDNRSFQKMSEDRDKKLKTKHIYWVDHWDRQLISTAIKRTQLARLHGWVFPEGKKKGTVYESADKDTDND